MNVSVQIMGEGTIYRNSLPHVYSKQAFFPSVLKLADGEYLAAFNIGQAFESRDLHTYLSRSSDHGATWTPPERLYPGTSDRTTTDTCRLSHGRNGEIIAFMIRHDRSREDCGFLNPENLGFVDVELLMLRSQDKGRTWSEPMPIHPPLTGPVFEMTSPIVPLRHGYWLLPTSTWHDWKGNCLNGLKMVAFVSEDGGTSWPKYIDIMSSEHNRLFFWESKVIQLEDGRLLAAAWVHDRESASDLPIHYAVGSLSGFSEPRPTDLRGQTLQLFPLEGNRFIIVYRRIDEPGLWACITRLEDGCEWISEQHYPLWGAHRAGLTSHSSDMAENFAKLKFGAPSICQTAPNELFISFWAVEDGLSAIRWIRVHIK